MRDPRQNVPLQPGDVISAIFEPLSFTALGRQRQERRSALRGAGHHAGSGADARRRADRHALRCAWAFIFRFKPEAALDWPSKPVRTTPEGLVPVVYRLDLHNPGNFFVMQNFAINNKDIVYVSDAPAVELQKFLSLVFSSVYPALNLATTIKSVK